MLNVWVLGYLARGEDINILGRLLRSIVHVYLIYMLLYQGEYLHISNNTDQIQQLYTYIVYLTCNDD
jgi:hypothetical protein